MVKVVSVQRRADGNEWRWFYNRDALHCWGWTAALLGTDSCVVGDGQWRGHVYLPVLSPAVVTSQRLREVKHVPGWPWELSV